MSNDLLRYDKLVENALRGVVREALISVAEKGLPGNHHFYITFRTGYPGVQIPGYLTAQYPQEMTIVLQYQFYGLEVQREGFAVTLSFGGVHERLSIPFAAISTFADPSVNFALQFQPAGAAEPEEAPAPVPAPAPRKAAEPAAEEPAPTPEGGKVVTLDAFRKK